MSWLLDVMLVGPLVLLALGLRLINLHLYSGLFDEGIRVEQLFLMSHGYRPFRDIFAAQGPLLLDAFYPVYVVTSQIVNHPLVAVRLVPVGYSLVGLVGVYWLGRQLAGRIGGFAAAIVLATSPLYLEGSRLALAEVPALAPAIVALGCTLRYSQSGRRGWLVGGGLLLLVSLLMKPITLAAAPAIAVASLLRGRGGLRNLLAVGLGMLLLTAAVVWLLGFGGVWEQLVEYRQAATKAADWSLRKNLATLQNGLGFEPLALLPLAALGGLVLLLSDWRRALPAVLWAALGFVLLLSYSPLHGKHIVVVVPSLALLAGAGSVRLWQILRALAPASRGLLATAPLALTAAWYLATLIPLLGQTGQLLRVTADTDVDPAFEQYSDAVATIQVLSSPADFIVTDQPYLAFLAERKVPPQLVDTALTRIRSRSLTGEKARQAAQPYDPKLVLFWGDRLRSLPTFKSWVEREYQLVKVYNRRDDTDRALYLRRDQDLTRARERLWTSGAGGVSASFGGTMRLAGATLDRVELSNGQGASLSMLWEKRAPTAIDYHVLVELRTPDGALVLDDQEEALGGGSDGTSSWSPGRWLVQSSFVRATDAPPGDYVVALSLYDSKARARVPLDGQPGRRDLIVGTIAVR